jgi:GNAT superfamily N-acetyltransferase
VPVSGAVDFHLRRVGFRTGTADELMALHAVEAPIEAERRSDRVPQPVESYIAFARNLPSQFDDHAWLVEASDGSPVAAGFCWSNSAGDPRVMECDLFVRRDRRRQGIGSRLLATICNKTLKEGRTLLTWSTFDAVPAGEAFSRRVGARLARVNRTSELVLADVDWTMIESWTRAERARDLGYRLEMIDGAFPEHLRADAATLHHIMQTAPREDLDVGDVIVDAEFVAELDRALIEAGRRDGRCSYVIPPGHVSAGLKSPSSRGIPAPSFNRTPASTSLIAGWGSPSGRRRPCSNGSDTSGRRLDGCGRTMRSPTRPCSRSTTRSASRSPTHAPSGRQTSATFSAHSADGRFGYGRRRRRTHSTTIALTGERSVEPAIRATPLRRASARSALAHGRGRSSHFDRAKASRCSIHVARSCVGGGT